MDSATTPGASTTPETATDSRLVYPCTIHHNGRLGGLYTIFAESAQIRNEWKQKLDEAIGLRKVVQESNKVFEIETLSADTFLMPSIVPGGGAPAWTHENAFTGKVTCSVPFSEPIFFISARFFQRLLYQLPLTVEVLLLSGVQKGYGLDFGMILGVSSFGMDSENSPGY